MSQESALWAIHGFLCHSPPLSRQRCLEILQHDPVILDLLFECSNISRPAWYPESQVRFSKQLTRYICAEFGFTGGCYCVRGAGVFAPLSSQHRPRHSASV